MESQSRSLPRHVAILGAAGGLGQGILRVCRTSGVGFTAIVRSRPERVTEVPTGSRVAVVPSLADAHALADALSGADAVVTATGVTATSREHSALLSANMDAVETSMLAAGVDRIVLVNTLLSSLPGQQAVLANKDKRAAPSAAVLLWFLPGSVVWLVIAVLTERSYLHSGFWDLNWRAFYVLALVLLVLLVATSRHAFAHARARGVRRVLAYALAMAMAAITFAGVGVLVMDYGLLLVVRFGHGKPVQFRTQVDHTWRGKGCVHGMFTFYNGPLHRATGSCADAWSVPEPKIGDEIVVRELIGDWGGTIVSVKRHSD